MSLSVIFVTALVVGLTGAMMPGPLLTVTVAESARRGFLTGPLLIVGHAVLEGALVLALVGGLAVFLTLHSVTGTIAFLGGGFLIYMGHGIISDVLRGRVNLQAIQEAAATGDGEEPAKSRGILKLVGLGAVTSISNPYWSLWWATIGLTYITQSLDKGYLGLAAFFTGHISADFLWYGLIAYLVVKGKRFLSPPVYGEILVICGSFLMFLGGYFIWTGYKTFAGMV